MTQDSAVANDRRGSQRFRVSAPLTIIVGDHKIPAYTRDLSNRGVYFYLDSADQTAVNDDFEFVVELPPEITLSTCCRISCRGSWVRTEEGSAHFTGVAAKILDYSILRDAISKP